MSTLSSLNFEASCSRSARRGRVKSGLTRRTRCECSSAAAHDGPTLWPPLSPPPRRTMASFRRGSRARSYNTIRLVFIIGPVQLFVCEFMGNSP